MNACVIRGILCAILNAIFIAPFYFAKRCADISAISSLTFIVLCYWLHFNISVFLNIKTIIFAIYFRRKDERWWFFKMHQNRKVNSQESNRRRSFSITNVHNENCPITYKQCIRDASPVIYYIIRQWRKANIRISMTNIIRDTHHGNCMFLNNAMFIVFDCAYIFCTLFVYSHLIIVNMFICKVRDVIFAFNHNDKSVMIRIMKIECYFC